MGSLNEFEWLTTSNVTFPWQATEISSEIPQTALRFALLPRYSLGESSTGACRLLRDDIQKYRVMNREKASRKICGSLMLFYSVRNQ